MLFNIITLIIFMESTLASKEKTILTGSEEFKK